MEYGVTQFVVNAMPVNRSDDHLWSPMPMSGGGKSSAGVKVNQRSVLGYPPLWRAINLISSSVAGLPCDVFRRQRDGGKKVDMRHPMQYLLEKKANRWVHAYTFRRAMTAVAALHGNSFAAIDRVNGRPVGFIPWDAQNTMVKTDNGRLWYVTYVNGQPIRVPAEDMLHIRGFGGDGVMGWPMLELMKDALGVGMAAQQFGGRFFAQGSNMSGLLMVPGSFNEEKIRNTLQAWNSMQQGLTNSHKVALLQDGVKFQQLTIPNDAAQFLQTREHEIRATVSNITGVPPHMLGDSTRTSHNSLESEGQSYLDYTLQPWLQTWEAELEDKGLSEKEKINDSHVIEFNREALVQMTFESKVNGIYRQIESGVMTANEGRARLNMPSIGPEGDKFYHPANWVVAGEEPVTQGAAPMKETPTEPDQATNLLRAMVTTSVTDAVKIERDRIIQRAGMQPTNFLTAVDEFYSTWTDNTARALTDSDARLAIIAHAEQSKRILSDVHSVSTTASLKSNVADVVASWENRADTLVENLMKVVQK
jgi:HK97 family phage portal protein